MRASFSTLAMVTRNQVWQANGQQVVDSYASAQSWNKRVTPGPLIKGDFKRPNAWNYTLSSNSGGVGLQRRWAFPETVNKGKIFADGLIWSTLAYDPIPVLDTTTAVNNTRNRALGRLNERVRGSLDLATSLAEGGQTLKMLNLVARFKRTMVDMAISYNREIIRKLGATRTRRSLKRRLRDWQLGLKTRHAGQYRPVPITSAMLSSTTKLGANGWLEYTYGLSPLISDIYGVAGNIVGFVNQNTFITKSATQNLTGKQRVPYSYNGVTCEGVLADSGKVTVRFGARLIPNYDTSLAKWSSLNPISVAYELAPFSFVYDWIWDVGSYLRNMETALLYDCRFVYGYESTFVHYSRELVIDYFRQGTVSNAETQLLKATSNYWNTRFVRKVLDEYPAPYKPSFKVDLCSERLLSAAALLRQLIKR